jgi:hypothetical protein
LDDAETVNPYISLFELLAEKETVADGAWNIIVECGKRSRHAQCFLILEIES